MKNYKFLVDSNNISILQSYINKINKKYKSDYIKNHIIKDIKYIDQKTIWVVKNITVNRLDYQIKNNINYIIFNITNSFKYSSHFKKQRNIMNMFFNIINYEEKSNGTYSIIQIRRKNTKNMENKNFPLKLFKSPDNIYLPKYFQQIHKMPKYNNVKIDIGIHNIQKLTDKKKEIKTICFMDKNKFTTHYRYIDIIHMNKIMRSPLFIVNNKNSKHCGLNFINNFDEDQLGVETNKLFNIYHFIVNIPSKYIDVFYNYFNKIYLYILDKSDNDFLEYKIMEEIQQRFPLHYQDKGPIKKQLFDRDAEYIIRKIINKGD